MELTENMEEFLNDLIGKEWNRFIRKNKESSMIHSMKNWN